MFAVKFSKIIFPLKFEYGMQFILLCTYTTGENYVATQAKVRKTDLFSFLSIFVAPKAMKNQS